MTPPKTNAEKLKFCRPILNQYLDLMQELDGPDQDEFLATIDNNEFAMLCLGLSLVANCWYTNLKFLRGRAHERGVFKNIEDKIEDSIDWNVS